MEWRNDKKKRDGMKCLNLLFMNVCGMERKRVLEEEEEEAEEEDDDDEEEEEDDDDEEDSSDLELG